MSHAIQKSSLFESDCILHLGMCITLDIHESSLTQQLNCKCLCKNHFTKVYSIRVHVFLIYHVHLIECKLPLRRGTCSQEFQRYYFDKTSGLCKVFNYTGCGGNLNNFHTLGDCNKRCICSQRKDVGTCRENTPRYFYNTATNECQLFMYLGCAGNLNNFQDKSACEDVCKPKSEIRKRCLRRPEFGTCTNSTTRYYYDINCGCCKTFSYSGCEGNGNNFETEEQCLKKCETVKQSRDRSRSRAVTTATPATSTVAKTAAPSGGGAKAIIIQTHQNPPMMNNIFQNLINMIGGK